MEGSLMGKKQKRQCQDSIRVHIKNATLNITRKYSILLIVISVLIVVSGIVNQFSFKIYGSGQGNIAKVKIQLNALHLELNNALDSSEDELEQQEGNIAEQKKIINTSLDGLKAKMVGKKNTEIYNNICTYVEEYFTATDKLIKYEREGKKYNSQKVYNNQMAKILEDFDTQADQLLSCLNQGGNIAAQATLVITLTLAAGVFVISRIVNKKGNIAVGKLVDDVVNPIDELTLVAKKITEGNLKVSVMQNAHSEIGKFAMCLQEMMDALNRYIEDISSKLDTIVAHDLTVQIEEDYKGDFIPLKDSMNKIIQFLNEVFSSLDGMTKTVYLGAEQISNASQKVAELAVEEKASIDEVEKGMNNILEQALTNETLCKKANELTSETQRNMKDTKVQMKQMVSAMEKIDEASQNVSNILNIINSIAEQTNLLALNASIEAARAGESGKGFAVVATEISKLAEQCTTAAQDSKKRIEETLNAIEIGNDNANKMDSNFVVMAENIEEAAKATEKILVATDNQKNEVTHIKVKVDTMSQLIADNAAIAMENAGVSEELAAESNQLRGMLKDIKYIQ